MTKRTAKVAEKASKGQQVRKIGVRLGGYAAAKGVVSQTIGCCWPWPDTDERSWPVAATTSSLGMYVAIPMEHNEKQCAHYAWTRPFSEEKFEWPVVLRLRRQGYRV